jgi:AbrB family looped-hinge helix DNA binding protein
MSSTISIDNAGRLVLPKAIRDRFKLTGGSKLRIEPIGEHLELTPIVEDHETVLTKKKGLLIVPATGEKCDAVESIAASRDDRESDILG